MHRVAYVKYLLYKSNEKNEKKKNSEKNGTFHKQIMLKGANKHTMKIYDTCSKLSIRAQK